MSLFQLLKSPSLNNNILNVTAKQVMIHDSPVSPYFNGVKREHRLNNQEG